MSERGAHTKNIPSHPIVVIHLYTWEQYSQYNNIYFVIGSTKEICSRWTITSSRALTCSKGFRNGFCTQGMNIFYMIFFLIGREGGGAYSNFFCVGIAFNTLKLIFLPFNNIFSQFPVNYRNCFSLHRSVILSSLK